MIGAHTARSRSYGSYQALDVDSVLAYLRTEGGFERHLGAMTNLWRALECGDGNLNLIFVVQGPVGAVVVKQALPYVRMVGEGWPLSVRRNFFEHAALREQARWAPEFVPAVHHANEAMALIVMEFLTPHSVLRAGLIGARWFPDVGRHLGLFLARTLFNTSDLKQSGVEKKERVGAFLANSAMCQISENLIFDEPYFAAPMNHHTSPQLDDVACGLTRDTDLKIAVQDMKWRFVNQPESLIHGDLHTGSIMVAEGDTRVIDPEFAFYGPMGFDVGVLLANFLMAYISQSGHASRLGERDGYRAYLLDQMATLWSSFTNEFSRLWHADEGRADCNLYNPRLNVDLSSFSSQTLALRLQRIWNDALGFAGCEMIRRVVGLAHIADFESIKEPDRRAACERLTVGVARQLLVERANFSCVSALTAAVAALPC